MKTVIIGNGIAGYTAASTIRQLKPKAGITVISDEAELLYCACALPHYLAGDLRRRKLFLNSRQAYRNQAIKLLTGQKVIKIDPRAGRVYLETTDINYDTLIIATGSRPVMPGIPGIELKGVFPLKSLRDADNILDMPARSALVAGSGPIGVEAAIALRKRGLSVYLVEIANRIMPRLFDEALSARFKAILESHGAEVLTGEYVKDITGNGQAEGVVLGGGRSLECGLVIMAAGMKPEVTLARDAGVAIGELGGISVDPSMRTGIENIYACGDCVESNDLITGAKTMSMLWHNAKQQAEVAASNCAGLSQTYAGSINITSFDVFGTHAASLGVTEAGKGMMAVARSSPGGIQRIIFSDGRIVGVQSLGESRELGSLLHAIMRQKTDADRFQPGISLLLGKAMSCISRDGQFRPMWQR